MFNDFFNSQSVNQKVDSIQHDNSSLLNEEHITVYEFIIAELTNNDREIYNWIRSEKQEDFEKLSSYMRNQVINELVKYLL
jgi:succinate dehydrogenase flavin-adding protein (antitoxin of CptAB toxin-antitoxin module)